MVSKNRLKIIKSLATKKGRETHGLFVVEGYKSVCELVQRNLIPAQVLITNGLDEIQGVNSLFVTAREMQQISSLKTAPGYLAVFEIPKTVSLPQQGRIVVLDDVQDPGNLGTIIRLCDWFNIQHIVCSKNTVDAFNPKTVQASMASIARIHIHYTNLQDYLTAAALPIMVTAMDGTSIYNNALPQDAILVLGNESRGVAPQILEIGLKISIPQYGSKTAESLNVATATAIVLAEWSRTTGT